MSVTPTADESMPGNRRVTLDRMISWPSPFLIGRGRELSSHPIAGCRGAGYHARLTSEGGEAVSDVVYTAHIRIERIEGPHRRAWLPGKAEPVDFGVHGAVAEHYGVKPDTEHTTTLDYVVAATGG